jgi:hypothetical protein
VGDSGTLHLESLERPVSRRDGADESLRDAVAVELKLLDGVELGRAVRLLEDLVDVGLEVVVELLEEIFEEERQKLTSTACYIVNEVQREVGPRTDSSSRLLPT